MAPTALDQWSCDERSFEDVYRAHRASVFSAASRVAGPDRADGVTQDVFVGLWLEPHRFDSARGTLGAFLTTVARNLATDCVRSAAARLRREERVTRDFALTRPLVDVVDAVVASESAQRVASAISRLPATQRRPICVAFYGGLTYNETAVVLGAAEGTVKSRIRRGLSLLRDDLA